MAAHDVDTRASAPGGRLPRGVAVVVGVTFVALGLWAMIDPRSFFAVLAMFEPYNQHFLQDIGAFQVGLGAVLLLAGLSARADGLTVALVGVGVGAALHAVSHIVGRDLGGRPATDIPVLTVLAVLLIPISYLLLWRTAFGLRLRSCGENPAAADSLGVHVYRLKYIAVVISGALAGLGGVFLVFIANIYREGQTGGRGFIGLAALIFGNWRPGGLAAGAGLFGFADALQLRSRTAVVALLLLLAVLLAGVAIWQATRRRLVQAVVAGVFAVAGLIGFLTIDRLPDGIVFFTPHLTTLLVLSLASQRLRMPKADGLVYRRGES